MMAVKSTTGSLRCGTVHHPLFRRVPFRVPSRRQNRKTAV